MENLPEEMKGIVREVKDRDSDDKFLTINYMKLSVILWKSLQEEMKKREHIEARLFEVEDAIEDARQSLASIRDLKGKGKAKSKAKAKSKPKD